MDLAFRTRQRLNSMAARTEVRIASESGKTVPSTVNSGYEIWQTNRYVCYNVCLYCRVGELHLHSTSLLFITHHKLRVTHFPELKKNIFSDKMKHIGNVLSELDLYMPYMITDAMMSIAIKSHNITLSYGIIKITVEHWKDFIHVLGFSEFQILLYNYIIGANISSIVFVFKVDNGNDNTNVQAKQALEV